MADLAAVATAPPPDWGGDALTDFFQQATRNGWASFAQPATRPWFDRLRSIDQTFVDAIGYMRATSEQFGEPLMLVNAHAGFRAAAEFAMQARTCETYALLRSALECALYAVHFHRHPETFEVWARRGEGDVERRAVRKAFRANELLDGVRALSNGVGERAKNLYEFAIDMGAHPNETGIFGRAAFVAGTNGQPELQTRYLNPGTPAFLATLKTVSQSGVCVLECFQLIFRDRFALVGLDRRIDAHKPGL